MAGVVFSNGTIVTPEFLNDIPIENLADFEIGSFAAALDGAGFSGDDIPFTIWYLRVGRFVMLSFPQVIGTSDANTMVIKMTGQPASLDMDTVHLIPIVILDNTVTKIGIVQTNLTLGGSWTVQCPTTGYAYDPSGFTTSGLKGIQVNTISYNLDL